MDTDSKAFQILKNAFAEKVKNSESFNVNDDNVAGWDDPLDKDDNKSTNEAAIKKEPKAEKFEDKDDIIVDMIKEVAKNKKPISAEVLNKSPKNESTKVSDDLANMIKNSKPVKLSDLEGIDTAISSKSKEKDEDDELREKHPDAWAIKHGVPYTVTTPKKYFGEKSVNEGFFSKKEEKEEPQIDGSKIIKVAKEEKSKISNKAFQKIVYINDTAEPQSKYTPKLLVIGSVDKYNPDVMASLSFSDIDSECSKFSNSLKSALNNEGIEVSSVTIGASDILVTLK